MKKMKKNKFKMSPTELQGWLHTRSRGSLIENKKGRGSYRRKKKWNGDEQYPLYIRRSTSKFNSCILQRICYNTNIKRKELKTMELFWDDVIDLLEATDKEDVKWEASETLPVIVFKRKFVKRKNGKIVSFGYNNERAVDDLMLVLSDYAHSFDYDVDTHCWIFHFKKFVVIEVRVPED